MWIARRSSKKPMFPGQLDNMVAGGWPVDLTIEENVIKECAEEAGMCESLACQSESVGVMTYVMEIEKGLRRHAMYLYDLEVPESFVPTPVDGEVDSFHRMPIDEVSRIVRDTCEFKYNSSMAIIDFLCRSGRITAETHGYQEIIAGMRIAGRSRIHVLLNCLSENQARPLGPRRLAVLERMERILRLRIRRVGDSVPGSLQISSSEQSAREKMKNAQRSV